MPSCACLRMILESDQMIWAKKHIKCKYTNANAL